MVEKLKSILRPIPWSLLFRALSYSLVWFFGLSLYLSSYVSGWVFWLAVSGVAFYFYFFPPFGAARLLPPFILLIFFSFLLAPSFFGALILGIVFFLILGIKDLIFINRFSAYHILVMLLLFLMFVNFFYTFNRWDNALIIFFSLALAFFYFLLTLWFLDYKKAGEAGSGGGFSLFSFLKNKKRLKEILFMSFSSFLLWQAILVFAFLPLNFVYQTASLFIFSFILFEFTHDYIFGSLKREKILTLFGVFFFLMALILGGGEWEL